MAGQHEDLRPRQVAAARERHALPAFKVHHPNEHPKHSYRAKELRRRIFSPQSAPANSAPVLSDEHAACVDFHCAGYKVE